MRNLILLLTLFFSSQLLANSNTPALDTLPFSIVSDLPMAAPIAYKYVTDAPLVCIDTIDVNSNMDTLEFKNLTRFTSYLIEVHGLDMENDDIVQVQFGKDSIVNWLTNTSYGYTSQIITSGNDSNAGGNSLSQGNTFSRFGKLRGDIELSGFESGDYPYIKSNVTNLDGAIGTYKNDVWYNDTSDRITAVRFFGAVGRAFTGGRLIIYGKTPCE